MPACYHPPHNIHHTQINREQIFECEKAARALHQYLLRHRQWIDTSIYTQQKGKMCVRVQIDLRLDWKTNLCRKFWYSTGLPHHSCTARIVVTPHKLSIHFKLSKKNCSICDVCACACDGCLCISFVDIAFNWIAWIWQFLESK